MEEVIIALGGGDILRPWLRMLFPRFAPCLMLGIYRHTDDGEFSLEFISYFPDFRHSRQADAAPACPEIHQNILVSWHYINKVTHFSIHVLKFQIHEFATLCGLLGERYTLAEFIHPQRVLRDVRNGLLQMMNLSACQIISTFQQIVGKINGNHGMRMRVDERPDCRLFFAVGRKRLEFIEISLHLSACHFQVLVHKDFII